MKYSYSRIKMWTECPLKYKVVYIDRAVQKVDTPALIRGREIHEKLEHAVRTGVPADVPTPPGLIEKLHAGGAQVEIGLGMERDGELSIDLKGAFLGGYLDWLLRSNFRAIIGDWKTGKFNPDPLQADVYATLVRANTLAENVEFVWVYVDAVKTHRVEVDQHAEERVFRLIDMIEADHEYRPTPNQYCRFCPVTECRYHK